MGMESVVNLIYSISPRHTDEYYARKAREAAAMKPYRLCFKDVAGMLTPDRTRTPGETDSRKCRRRAGGVSRPLQQRSRAVQCPGSRQGKASASFIPRCRRWPTARRSRRCSTSPTICARWATSRWSMKRSWRRWRHISAHCAKDAGLPIGAPREYDEGWYRHQVPGGMISNLRHQLKMLGKEDKMADVLEEIVQVRAELGYPIMVTPFAQFVGSQAAINIMTGERYKEVTDQVIQFALGLWGKEGAQYMDKEVKAKILDRTRAREMESFQIPNTPLEEVRNQYGGAKVSDEELIMRYYAGPEFVDALKTAPPRKEYLDARKPLVKLVEELGNKKDLTQVYIKRGDISLSFRRGSEAG